MKLNGATWSIVEWIEGDETNRTMCYEGHPRSESRSRGRQSCGNWRFQNPPSFLKSPPSFSEIFEILSVIHLIWENIQNLSSHFFEFRFRFRFMALWSWLKRRFHPDFEGLKSVQKCRSSDWMVAMDNKRYRLLESCNRPPPWPSIWMPLGPELSEFSIV